MLLDFYFQIKHKSFIVDEISFNATTNPNGPGDVNLYGSLLKQYADRRKTNVFFQPVTTLLAVQPFSLNHKNWVNPGTEKKPLQKPKGKC